MQIGDVPISGWGYLGQMSCSFVFSLHVQTCVLLCILCRAACMMCVFCFCFDLSTNRHNLQEGVEHASWRKAALQEQFMQNTHTIKQLHKKLNSIKGTKTFPDDATHNHKVQHAKNVIHAHINQMHNKLCVIHQSAQTCTLSNIYRTGRARHANASFRHLRG